MATTNKTKKTPKKIVAKKSSPVVKTHGGGLTTSASKIEELTRSTLACMLWEDTSYENGVSIANRIQDLVPQCHATEVANLAITARNTMGLRHAPLWLVVAMLRTGGGHRTLVRSVLPQIVNRPDELSEILSLYWKDGKVPIASSLKKGLSDSFRKFNEYQLAKYNRDKDIKLKDVLFLVHPKAKDPEQQNLWNRLAEDKLITPDTWETELSAGKDKKETFERLIKEKKLGALALIRNLRNMHTNGVDTKLVESAIANMDTSKVFPFNFISAKQHAPMYRESLQNAMLKSARNLPKLKGKTVIVVDVSGSMYGGKISEKSELNRAMGACSLAAIAKEMCESAIIYATGGSDAARKHATIEINGCSGFDLVDKIYGSFNKLGGGGIFLNQVSEYIKKQEGSADRTFVITDEQDCSNTSADSPKNAKPLGNGYILNVNTYKNGIGYDKWTHLTGFSENVIAYIGAYEQFRSTATNASFN